MANVRRRNKSNGVRPSSGAAIWSDLNRMNNSHALRPGTGALQLKIKKALLAERLGVFSLNEIV